MKFGPERFRFSAVKLTNMKRITIATLIIAMIVTGFLIFVQPRRDTGNNSTQREKQSGEAEQTATAHREQHGEASSWATAPIIVNPPPTNWLARMRANGDRPRLTAEEADAFVTANKRSAESLLAAFRGTKDKAYLQEALEKFPDDPKVNFVGYFDALFYKENSTPEERRALLERFAKSAPENSMANYLAASDYFKTGETDKALEQFRNASTKSSLQDYSLEFTQNAEEAYRQAGYSEADAKEIADSSLLVPHLSPLKQTGVELLEIAGRYQQSGDEARAFEAREMALHLADLLQDGSQQKLIINQLVGIAIERKILGALDPNSTYDSSGRTVQNRIDELIQNRKNLNANVGQMGNLLPAMTPADRSAFFVRIRIYGEASAMRWAVGKYGN